MGTLKDDDRTEFRNFWVSHENITVSFTFVQQRPFLETPCTQFGRYDMEIVSQQPRHGLCVYCMNCSSGEHLVSLTEMEEPLQN